MAPKRYSEPVVTHSLKELKEALKRKRTRVRQEKKVLEKSQLISDAELFLEAMKEVIEIEEFRKMPVYQKAIAPSSKRTSTDQEVIRALHETVSGRRPIVLADTQEYVEWIDQDYRVDIIENLHKGRYAVQDCLDLHGVVVEEAEIEVENFLRESVKKGFRCVKIIHGRGLCSPRGPVLKDVVIKWLSGRYRKYIIAFVTARQCDGGLGALYVLLK